MVASMSASCAVEISIGSEPPRTIFVRRFSFLPLYAYGVRQANDSSVGLYWAFSPVILRMFGRFLCFFME
ncbi:hypothetical protein SELSPUOL_00501 [Selenomonas sputigena ATCC 35185]|uniref:Uncharacterized protein n=1 Tax=Selenomonas sputigena (strain ATCC 35185 / DSM 20758 / CCUG 44933 / VPI D19B-28) TaxID=546271 RepID=C9LSS5_SELS3|nr:hypothetical protein SELSPUOL_00501 [Selenomonas sputigena ATCC 35185]